MNCAGISAGRTTILDQTYEQIENIIDTNLFSIICACKDFVEISKENTVSNTSNIINVSSLVASTGGFNLVTYLLHRNWVDDIFPKLLQRDWPSGTS